MIKQLERVARVFARDEIDGAQHFESTMRHVLKIADRRRNQVKRSVHSLTITKKARVTRDAGIKKIGELIWLERPPARHAVTAIAVATTVAPTAVAASAVIVVCIGDDTKIVTDLVPVVEVETASTDLAI